MPHITCGECEAWAAEVAELQRKLKNARGMLAAVETAVAARLGGWVEGEPTHEGNYLARIDSLVRKEAENDPLRHDLGRLRSAITQALKDLQSAQHEEQAENIKEFVGYAKFKLAATVRPNASHQPPDTKHKRN
jgi:IMP dehydrogenase/GMP reductase